MNKQTHFTLPFSFKANVLALGAETGTTFAILKKNRIYISRTYSDLKDPQIFEDFKKDIKSSKRRLKFNEDTLACDVHPGYESSGYSRDICPKGKKPRLYEIQHHHAHIASCMVQHGLKQKVIGVAFDGTGYGPDSHSWGGEILICDYCNFERKAHIDYIKMPGSNKAVLEPIRMAFSYLYKAYNNKVDKLPPYFLKKIGRKNSHLFKDMIDRKINSPLTSSAGRLFDAVSSLIGLKECISYEGEAAILLENSATAIKGFYNYNINKVNGEYILNFDKMIKEITYEYSHGKRIGVISGKFHNTLAKSITDACILIKNKYTLSRVCLGGGVFQNKLLTFLTKKYLEGKGFKVYTNNALSPSDKSLSLGQAVIAASKAD